MPLPPLHGHCGLSCRSSSALARVTTTCCAYGCPGLGRCSYFSSHWHRCFLLLSSYCRVRWYCSSITTAFALFEICLVGLMLNSHALTVYYVNLGCRWLCLPLFWHSDGVLSTFFSPATICMSSSSAKGVMGLRPANGTTPRQQ